MAATKSRSTTAKTKTTKASTAKKPAAKTTAAKKPAPAKKAAPAKKTTTTKKPATPKKAAAAKKPAAPRKAAPRKNVSNASGPSLTLHGIEPYKVKRGEEYMSEPQLDHFRAILQAWRQELMEEVDRTVSHMKDEAANFPDPADRATQEEEFSLELRTRDRERKLIKKIDSTLVRIENDDYGWCDQCGVEVGIRRLEARPTASLCVDCKTLDEIREKQLTG